MLLVSQTAKGDCAPAASDAGSWHGARCSKGRGSIRGDCCAQAADRLRGAYGAPEGSFKLGAQSLSNMVYAYAVLGHHPGVELLSAIAKGVQWQLRDFSPQVCT